MNFIADDIDHIIGAFGREGTAAGDRVRRQDGGFRPAIGQEILGIDHEDTLVNEFAVDRDRFHAAVEHRGGGIDRDAVRPDRRIEEVFAAGDVDDRIVGQGRDGLAEGRERVFAEEQEFVVADGADRAGLSGVGAVHVEVLDGALDDDGAAGGHDFVLGPLILGHDDVGDVLEHIVHAEDDLALSGIAGDVDIDRAAGGGHAERVALESRARGQVEFLEPVGVTDEVIAGQVQGLRTVEGLRKFVVVQTTGQQIAGDFGVFDVENEVGVAGRNGTETGAEVVVKGEPHGAVAAADGAVLDVDRDGAFGRLVAVLDPPPLVLRNTDVGEVDDNVRALAGDALEGFVLADRGVADEQDVVADDRINEIERDGSGFIFCAEDVHEVHAGHEDRAGVAADRGTDHIDGHVADDVLVVFPRIAQRIADVAEQVAAAGGGDRAVFHSQPDIAVVELVAGGVAVDQDGNRTVGDVEVAHPVVGVDAVAVAAVDVQALARLHRVDAVGEVVERIDAPDQAFACDRVDLPFGDVLAVVPERGVDVEVVDTHQVNVAVVVTVVGEKILVGLTDHADGRGFDIGDAAARGKDHGIRIVHGIAGHIDRDGGIGFHFDAAGDCDGLAGSEIDGGESGETVRGEVGFDREAAAGGEDAVERSADGIRIDDHVVVPVQDDRLSRGTAFDVERAAVAERRRGLREGIECVDVPDEGSVADELVMDIVFGPLGIREGVGDIYGDQHQGLAVIEECIAEIVAVDHVDRDIRPGVEAAFGDQDPPRGTGETGRIDGDRRAGEGFEEFDQAVRAERDVVETGDRPDGGVAEEDQFAVAADEVRAAVEDAGNRRTVVDGDQGIAVDLRIFAGDGDVRDRRTAGHGDVDGVDGISLGRNSQEFSLDFDRRGAGSVAAVHVRETASVQDDAVALRIEVPGDGILDVDGRVAAVVRGFHGGPVRRDGVVAEHEVVHPAVGIRDGSAVDRLGVIRAEVDVAGGPVDEDAPVANARPVAFDLVAVFIKEPGVFAVDAGDRGGNHDVFLHFAGIAGFAAKDDAIAAAGHRDGTAGQKCAVGDLDGGKVADETDVVEAIHMKCARTVDAAGAAGIPAAAAAQTPLRHGQAADVDVRFALPVTFKIFTEKTD